MNKEQLIQQLKYTKEKHKNDKLFTFDTDISAMCSDVLDVLNRCVEIPDNATNGDVIKAMFPNLKITKMNDSVSVMGEYYEFNNFYPFDFWNAPYQKGGTNRKNCEYRHENGNCLKVGGFCMSVDDEHCVKGGRE